MKRAVALLIVAGAMVLFAEHELAARGPGGGARGGGMSRPSPSVGRSPSLGGGGTRPSPGASRPTPGARPGTGAVTRPAPASRPGGATRPAPGTRPSGAGPGIAGGRPTAGQLNDFLDIPRPATGAIAAGAVTRPAGGGAAADFLGEGGAGRPSTLPAERPIASERPGVDNRQDRRQGLAENRPDRIDNRQEWQDNRQERRGEVWDQVQDNYPRLDFWTDHPNWAAWRINAPYRWATWAAVTGWVGYGWSEPTYYNYGDNVYYQDNAVYYGDEQVATAEEYAQQAETIATSAPASDPAKAEWMPLGVFAMTQDGQATGATPTLFVQLAISKEGILSGTFNNKSTGETQTLEGMADKKSQRAAWGVKGKERPIMETGVNNLTQDTTQTLVHFADGTTQQWLLVRLEQPLEQK
jgi:hypothetical protein